MNKFWNWKMCNQETSKENETAKERVLFINGVIAEESWFDDEITPKLFREELNSENGDITVWINSPGGDCVAAAQIYNMLIEYKGKVTIKIDGLAASAASVIAMAGDTVLVSPVSMIMIHNPATMAFGDHTKMAKAIEMLENVKNSIINAYALKTGMSRVKLSKLMDAETWMDATKAVELGFADAMMKKSTEMNENRISDSLIFSRQEVNNALFNKLGEHYKNPDITEYTQILEKKITHSISANEIRNRLDIIKKYI